MPDVSAKSNPGSRKEILLVSALAETSPTARNASAIPASASGGGLCPSTSPKATGTLAPTTAVIGDTMPMRPTASAAYRQAIATPPAIPAATPQTMSLA